jgi:hypothetical protein
MAARATPSAIWNDIRPKRVPVPTTIACGEVVDTRDRGGLAEFVAGCLRGLRRWEFRHALYVG